MPSYIAFWMRSPDTSSGRWSRSHLRPLCLAPLLPAVLSLSCAKTEQVAPEAGLPPQLAWTPPLAYPPAMFETGVEGRVVLEAIVDSTGRVEPSTIEVVSTTRSEFEQPAIDMLRNSRFTPSRTGARAVRIQVRLPVVFDLKRASNVDSADSAAAAALATEGASLARQGNVDDALTAYSEALGLDARLNRSVGLWHGLCWHGSLWGYAENVMFACKHAVELEPLMPHTREARGLARAMTSDYAGAIEDLEQSAARALTSDERVERIGWIGSLKSGKNPFTEDVLRALRQRTN